MSKTYQGSRGEVEAGFLAAVANWKAANGLTEAPTAQLVIPTVERRTGIDYECEPCAKGHKARDLRYGWCAICRADRKHEQALRNADQTAARNAQWRLDNPERYAVGSRANNAERRALQRRQRCQCCTRADFLPIYREGRRTGCEVDHVLALALGGLHCVENLQLLTPTDHKIKTRADRREMSKQRILERQPVQVG